jgi:non-homologous end joining protein Ku
MHEKEHVVAISFYKNMLLLTTLHYEHEIKTLEIEDVKSLMPTQEELSLAFLLIDKLTHKKFDLSKYKDAYVEKLKKALIALSKGKKVKKPSQKSQKKPKDQSLTATLKESLRTEARA